MSSPIQLRLARTNPGNAHRSLAVTRKGFRPFFLLAAVYAALIVPLWLVVLDGQWAVSWSSPSLWHAHEMVFGYTSAVIAGFLLTAVARWTERETAVGMPLVLLCSTWLAGRIALLAAGSLPPTVVAALDLLFLPSLAVAIGRPILASGNRRNFGMLGIIAVLFGANLMMHLDALAVLPGWGRRGALLGTHAIVVMMLIIGGRVIPMFTRNATGDDRIAGSPLWDRVAIGSAAVVMLLTATVGDGVATSAVAALAAIAVTLRARRWGVRASLRDPMLWILHMGHAWIALGFAFQALAPRFPQLTAGAIHAHTAGAVGSLTLGMMARVSLGHTGRLITATPLTRVVFALISAAALVRVTAPLAPASYSALLAVAGTLWTLAFAGFLFAFTPALLRSRVDGTDG